MGPARRRTQSSPPWVVSTVPLGIRALDARLDGPERSAAGGIAPERDPIRAFGAGDRAVSVAHGAKAALYGPGSACKMETASATADASTAPMMAPATA